MKNPCFNKETRTDCPKRCAGCAVNCPEWAAYVKERDAEYERRKIESAVGSILLSNRNKALDSRIKRDIHYKRSHRGHMD